MGEDTRAANEGGVDEARLRARGTAARRASGDSPEARPAGGNGLGPFELNEAHLVAWGRTVGRVVALPAVFALRGDLGAGKSVLARAIAQGAGVTTAMPSPTFNLLFQYETDGHTINHLDLYRLEDPSEVWELGWHDLGEENQIVLIEWPERAAALLPVPRWDIYLEPSTRSPLLRELWLVPVSDPPELPLPEASA